MRAWLAVLALVGYFVLLGAIVCACVWMIVEQRGTWAILLGIVLICALLTGNLGFSGRARYQAHGAYMTRTSQPELWRVVDELAATARTRTPDEIVIVAHANAMVWEDTRLLGLRQGFRHLAIGLPLVAGMSVNELRAVIGHELGHFSHGHTKMAALTYRATNGHAGNRGGHQWQRGRLAAARLLTAVHGIRGFGEPGTGAGSRRGGRAGSGQSRRPIRVPRGPRAGQGVAGVHRDVLRAAAVRRSDSGAAQGFP
ncbi:M48 family metallopeptidase [Kibdelosporangium philippinense]|uniref:M48 family metallopeptidase n=1 Tax=Kibdelosporangium philippinense TaxID=211113 RepID=A0ABS8ZV54_9PSEU|nr:M48 family metallopeptidase [Kibdelosporangium philippinense]MCE7011581.1 M48 family metallopeptidase [Kibdelosporangium philippinense]